jgi:hypothetical protein
MFKNKNILSLLCLSLFCILTCQRNFTEKQNEQSWLILKDSDLHHGTYHTKHTEVFGKYVRGLNNGINSHILKGIDIVQAHAMDGGSYFTGKDSIPTESPVYYNLKLFNRPLIEVPRHSSYCSGATYTAFIEALNRIFPGGQEKLSEDRYEAMRMQELDGGRREDHVKFWGHWNADGFGNHFALIQYSKMGSVINPQKALPGDFVNISWKSGLGHSVIFLGWAVIDNDKKIVYWSSQRATNGYGDQVVSLQKVKSIKVIRLTHPENMFTFNPLEVVNRDVPGDSINW